LVADKKEGVVVPPAFSAVQRQDGGGAVARDLDDVPLAVVDVDSAQPDLLLLRPQGVEVVAELELALLDL